jgi:hypothetical protein
MLYIGGITRIAGGVSCERREWRGEKLGDADDFFRMYSVRALMTATSCGNESASY